MHQDSRRDDRTEPCALDDDVGLGFATDLGHDRPDVFALTVAVRPDHQVRRVTSLGEEVRLDALMVCILCEMPNYHQPVAWLAAEEPNACGPYAPG